MRSEIGSIPPPTGVHPQFQSILALSARFAGFVSIIMLLAMHDAYAMTPPRSESVIVGISSNILSLDPTNHRDRDTQMVLKNIFDSLTTRDKHLLVVPQLAESWRPLDQTTWEFKLRKGIVFHNGDGFTAQDVKFTLDRVTKEGALEGRTSPRRTLLERISDVKVLDPYTFQILTDKPWPILPLMLTLQEIVPRHYIQRVGTERFEKAPVGTGPYQFSSRSKDGALILKRFDQYYGGAPENPPVQVAQSEYLIFKTIPDPALRTALLKKGQADIITNVPVETIPLFDMLPHLSVMGQPATRSYFADLNCRKPPFNDVRARLAINYAMDMRLVVNTMFQGNARILPTILLQQAFAYNDRLLPYPHDPDKAKELFRLAGVSKNYKLRIVCIEKYARFANSISLFLSKIGMKSTITIGEKKVVRAAMKNLTADILVTSWGNTTLDPVGILMPKLKTKGRGNFSNYSNPKVDELLLLSEKTLSQEERDAHYKKIQEIIYREAPMLFGYASEEFYGVSRRIKGFYPSATGMLNLHDVTIEK